MGAIRNAVMSFDPAPDRAKEQKELVETLAQLAETKAENYEMAIQQELNDAGSNTNRTVPIEAILVTKRETHAYSSSKVDQIGKTIGSSLKQFASGTADGILNGVTTLMTEALTAFLGEASAATGTTEQYYVMTEGLSVIRVDLKAWYLNVQSGGISTNMQRVSAFVAAKSAVDLAKIKFNTFLNLYQKQLAAAKIDQEKIQVALQEARKIYVSFNNPQNAARAAALPADLAMENVVVPDPPASFQLAPQ